MKCNKSGVFIIFALTAEGIYYPVTFGPGGKREYINSTGWLERTTGEMATTRTYRRSRPAIIKYIRDSWLYNESVVRSTLSSWKIMVTFLIKVICAGEEYRQNKEM